MGVHVVANQFRANVDKALSGDKHIGATRGRFILAKLTIVTAKNNKRLPRMAAKFDKLLVNQRINASRCILVS